MALDTLYQAETPEGISLSLRPAGIVARSQAWLIDLAIRVGLFILASMIVGVLGGMGKAFLLISYFLLEWFYPVVFELTRLAATPGKRAMGLKVVMDSGLPVTPGASIVRNLLRAADFLPFMYAAGALTLLFRADFKRLGDLAGGTLVVYSEPVQLHGAVPEAQPLAPARPLTQGEQASILAWASRASRLTSARFEELAFFASAASVASSSERLSPQILTERLLGVAHWILGHRGTQR